MIRLIEALNYRCLRYVKQELGDFHVLVGPNASGKTSFLDVVSFLGDLVSEGLDKAVQKRTSNFEDLLFAHQGNRFELAIELEILPDQAKSLPRERAFKAIRYEISIGMKENEIHIFDEKVILLNSISKASAQREFFPSPLSPPATIMTSMTQKSRRIVTKVYAGNDNYYSEVHKQGGKGWAPSIRLGPTKSALANLPADDTNFPVSTWLRDILREGVQQVMLNSLALRKSSPPGQGLKFKPDGSNLPWVIHNMRAIELPEQHKQWVEHVRTALPELKDIDTVELPDTRHKYLKLIYDNGLEVPAWMASDGTLRLIALTLPAYLSDLKGIYLIEEPENGIHPMAMETVYQSLHSVYDAQILLATHSPVILGCAQTSDILCFKKSENGATDIVVGNEHPALREWQGNLRISDLYASGVLG